MKDNCWECIVGPADWKKLPQGADLPMRKAVEAAFFKLTGEYPEWLSSGWGTPVPKHWVSEKKRKPYSALDRYHKEEAKKLTKRKGAE